jgi:hypothetical protein
MKRKIGFALVAAAIGFAIIALAQAGIGPFKHTERASAGLGVLQPAW